MPETLQPDLCVIGAGSGGLSVAAAAAQFGVDVVLIEKGKMGGDCLNYGCVPSKAMLAAGKRLHHMRTSEAFGVGATAAEADARRVHDHVHGVIAAIAPNDSEARFTGLGVRVIRAAARFVDRRTVAAGDAKIAARRFVVATGSSPAVPPIPGLDKVAYFTNETIFDNTNTLPHLLVIGGGPIGVELAQAHRRLGSEVTVLEAMQALGKDDPEAAAVVLHALEVEGVRVLQGARIERIESSRGVISIHYVMDGESRTVEGSHVLAATGRKPNVDGLDLDAAGIEHDRRGIKVGKGLKTTNGRVYAIGDVAGGLQFTHVANYHAGLVIRNALFRLPVKVDTTAVPWVTFTEPELAHVGLTAEQARKWYRKPCILRWPYAENDRAQAERATEGLIKVVTSKRGRILGVTIVGEHAGELIHVWALALAKGMKIGDLTSVVLPYPTLGEINKRVAYTFYLGSLTNPLIRAIIKFLRLFG